MKKFGIIAAAAFLPSLASAATLTTPESILTYIQSLIGMALPIIIALAVVYFIWGIFRYVVAGDEEAKKGAKDKIIYGIVGLFVMISVWGLVNVLSTTTGLTNTAPTIPTIPTTTGI